MDEKPTEDYYRRLEDQKWREGVNDRLASLTASEVVQNDRLDDLDEDLMTLRAIVEGDPGDKNDNGIKGDIHDMGTKLNQLWAVIFTDAAGGKGMYEEFKKTQSGEHRWEVKRTTLTAIIVAIISTVGLLLREWPDIKALFWNTTPVAISEKSRTHPRTRRRIRVEATTHDEAPVLPEGRNEDAGDAR